MQSPITQFVITLFTLLLTSMKVSAAYTNPPPIDIDASFSQQKIGRNVVFFPDPTDALTLKQIRTPGLSSQFTSIDKDNPSFSYTKSAYWARFNLDIQTSEPRNGTEPLFLTSEQALDRQVKQRTAELETTTIELRSANQRISLALIEAQKAKEAAILSQNQLIEAETMASLGLLVSNVAHEINSPISAVQANNTLTMTSFDSILLELPRLLMTLPATQQILLTRLIESILQSRNPICTREERQLNKQLSFQLEQLGIEEANRKARSGNERTTAMFESQMYQSIEKALDTLEPLFQHVDVVRNYQDAAPLRCDLDALQQLWGQINVQSEVGGGSTFTVTLPYLP